MLRRLPRIALVGASMALALSASPTVAGAQAFQSCLTPGVCGRVDALLTGTNLRVRVQNQDATFGSALFHVMIGFSNNLGTTPGQVLNASSTVTAGGNTTTIGTVGNGTWAFGGIGGLNVLDLSTFFSDYIEGDMASPLRAAAGDPDNGTYITGGPEGTSYVEFNGNLSGIAGVSGSRINMLGFETDQGAIATPEPASMMLLGTGLAVLGLRFRRRRSES